MAKYCYNIEKCIGFVFRIIKQNSELFLKSSHIDRNMNQNQAHYDFGSSISKLFLHMPLLKSMAYLILDFPNNQSLLCLF